MCERREGRAEEGEGIIEIKHFINCSVSKYIKGHVFFQWLFLIC